MFLLLCSTLQSCQYHSIYGIDNRMTDGRRIENDLVGSGTDVLEVVSRHFTGVTKENLITVGVPNDIRTAI